MTTTTAVDEAYREGYSAGSRDVAELSARMQQAPAVSIQRETPSSIELGINSKGEPVYTIKCYCEVGQEGQALKAALALQAQCRQMLGLPPLGAL